MSRIPRIHTPQRLASQAGVTLDEEAAHHVGRVLRLGPGDPLVLFDGRGGEYSARISHADRKTVRAQVEEYRDVERESPLRITLYQGISRGKRMNYTLQKAVELGVYSIVPVETARSVTGLQDQGQKASQRWQRIVRSAAEQSGRTRIPAVEEILPFTRILDLPSGSHALVMTQYAETGPEALDSAPEDLRVLIGPEGGLTDHEVKLARKAGYRGLRMGPRTLRTETAGVVILSILQNRWGDLESWGSSESI